ncbi:hypothetical protein NKH33_30045 [Mesorhizobium sp. M1182]|uniref:hypothetical protein n=1 Tax=Mesorhizobium sp. M1182 TaxID=2957067 RepID=UPI00333CE3C7
MDAFTRVQVVWAETRDLRVPAGGDPATLSTLRQNVAAIANEAEKSFSRFEPVPARDDPFFGSDVLDCVAAAEVSQSAGLKNLRVILWPSADGKTLSKDDLEPPAPWNTAAPETLELIGRFTVEGHEVSAFSRVVGGGEDAPRFVSLVTGTGLPPGTGVYAPRETPRTRVDPKVGRTAFRLAMAAVALFAVACLWSLSVGNLTRTAQATFTVNSADQSCPTSIDPGNPATLYGAPRAWLPTATGDGECLKAWKAATSTVLEAPDRDWWSRMKGWLASWTLSDSGRAFSLRMPMLLMMASIVVLAASVGLGVMGRPFGLFIDRRNRMSLTRIQFAVWLVILMGGIATYALFNVGFWAEDLNRIHEGLAFVANAGSSDQKLAAWSDRLSSLMEYLPGMDLALWALIGISGGTAIVSSFIMQPGTSGTKAGAGTVMPPRKTRVLSNPDPKDAQLSDLVYGETEEDDGVVDSTRVQAVVVTGVLAAIYINLALEAAERIGGLTSAQAVNSGTQVFASMPPAGATFLWLLGLSHGTLLGGKLIGAYKGTGT